MEHLFDSNENTYQNHKGTRLSVGNNSIKELTDFCGYSIYMELINRPLVHKDTYGVPIHFLILAKHANRRNKISTIIGKIKMDIWL